MNDKLYKISHEIIDKQQKQIAELTHALNELYEIGYEIHSQFDLDVNFDGVLDTRLSLALKQADKLLEGN